MDLPKRISSGWQGRRRKDIPCQSVIVNCTCLSATQEAEAEGLFDSKSSKLSQNSKHRKKEMKKKKPANPIARINKCPEKLKNTELNIKRRWSLPRNLWLCPCLLGLVFP